MGSPIAPSTAFYRRDSHGGEMSAVRREMLTGLQELNSKTHKKFNDPETQARIAQYEMAFRMDNAQIYKQRLIHPNI